MALKDELRPVRERLLQQAGSAIDTVAAIANDLAMEKIATGLKDVHDRLQSDTFDLIVVGRFKNGKSTLLNALLGKLTHSIAELQNGHGPLPVDDLPCTAPLTRIQYADKPYVRAWGVDEKYKEWSLTQYLRESTVRTDEEETIKFFQAIREFELGLPAELCQSGVTLIDSPGTSDSRWRTEITREAVKHCDAAIVVYRSDAFAGQDERKFIDSDIVGIGTRVFTVTNVMGAKLVDERLKGFVWNRLVKEQRNGPKYAGQDVQDFASWDIYFVNALKGQEGKLTGNAQLVAESGLDLLEQRLAQFLLNDRQRIHLGHFLRRAEVLITSMEQKIGQRRVALQADEQQLQQAYEAIQPQLAAIHSRRDKLPKLFERYRRECEREIKVSFEQMITQLRQDLPEELKRHPLPSLESIGEKAIAPFRQKRLCREALELCNTIVAERIKDWQEAPPERSGIQQVITPILDRLFEDLCDEVAAIDRTLNQVHLQLTGWVLGPEDGIKSVISLQERVLSGVAGLFVGDFSSILGASGMGYRGVAGVAAGQIAAGIVLKALGITVGIFSPFLLIPGILVGVAWGAAGLGDRVKRKVLEEADQKLQTIPANVKGELDQEAVKLFNQIEAEVMQEVVATIEAEKRNISAIMERNKCRKAEKAQRLVVLDETFRKLVSQRHALKEVMVQVEQTS